MSKKKVKITQSEVVTVEEFSYWLRNSIKFLESKGLKRGEISELIETTLPTIRQYEAGKMIPQDPYVLVQRIRQLLKEQRK